MTNVLKLDTRLIESDDFPFEFLSKLAERESWRKEIHRPVYHVHKWWAKRLGSVFRGILLGSALPHDADLCEEFYRTHNFDNVNVFDPFMGSGTTIGEAHKLGMPVLGRDINPVAVRAVATAFGPMPRKRITEAFNALSESIGKTIRHLYRSSDSQGRPCDILYNFWVMQAGCVHCTKSVDLFPSYIIARNASPDRNPEIQILCPKCGDIFLGVNSSSHVNCRTCGFAFDISASPAKGANATCTSCHKTFSIITAIRQHKSRPDYRHYGKLVLTGNGFKEYLPAGENDHKTYAECSGLLRALELSGELRLPELSLEQGHNTRQAMNYGFNRWRDFFNDRQLLALGQLYRSIQELDDVEVRDVLATLFSGVLEFNNLFASYKGEGTGAVRHMFAHHILKPERTPIEANIWGTSKSSGSFSNLFRGRLLRAIDYRESPTEIKGTKSSSLVCSLPFTGVVDDHWPQKEIHAKRSVFLSCGDSASSGLPSGSIDLVVTDPPFFDNVHYSELADFFHAWQQLYPAGAKLSSSSTRHDCEVQDADAAHFSEKLERVFRESLRVLKDSGLLVFTYHHSREEGWHSLAGAILNAGFVVVNSHPVRAEMSVAVPKSQAKEPINFDIVLVCRKNSVASRISRPTVEESLTRARAKLIRLQEAGFRLSRNDRKIVLYGQLLTSIQNARDIEGLAQQISNELASPLTEVQMVSTAEVQRVLFE